MEDAEDTEKAEVPSMTAADAVKMYERYKQHWHNNYKEAAIDLKMAIGDPQTHYGLGWDDKYTAPMGPMVVDNELPQYIHQVTNDIRQNTPSIKVIPEEDGDEETADVFSGLARSIEYKSCADEAYDTAAEYAVKCAIGFIAVDHDYCDDDVDEQELQIKSVPDPLSVFLDPASVECDGRDANSCIVLEPINKEDFERLYNGKAFVSFTDSQNKKNTDESIVLANIYIRRFVGARGKKAVIHRYKYSGEDLLAETTFPGKYIPYVPVYGEISWIDGKRILGSLIRQARSPQRRLNHMLSKESQVLAQAPIAPIMAAEGTLVNERKQYQIPGLENALEYRQTDLDGKDAPMPTRLSPPAASSGFLEAIASAKEAIKASMGIYAAGLGKREGDASGRALESLKQEGDVATFHFPDNVRRSINQIGRIIVEAAPEIYDTPRIIQIVNEEQDVKMVGVNGAKLQEGQKQKYDLTKGKYHVRVTTGASYTTKRQAAADLFGEVIKTNPELLSVIGDLWAKNLDVPGAEAMASRFKKMIPPQLHDEQEQQDPQVVALTQQLQQAQQIIEQGAQEIQGLQAQLESKQVEAVVSLQESEMKARADIAKAEVDKLKLEVEQKKILLEDKKLDVELMKLSMPQEEAEPVQSAPQSLPPIKLDTTGFQFAKTPEQEAMEAEAQNAELQLKQQEIMLEQQEQQLRAAQGDALINMMGAIVSRLDALTSQVSKQPVIVRDPQTNMIQGVTYQ